MKDIKTKVDDAVQKELSKHALIIAYVLLVVGIVGDILFILSDILFMQDWMGLLILCSIPLGIGAVLIFTINKNIKLARNNHSENLYVFDTDFITVITTKNNEEVGIAKISYKDLLKAKETKNYIFLYINNVSALPILKTQFEAEDLNDFKNLIKINIKKHNIK